MAQDTHCLFSAVRNTSGGRMICGFLPPHGRELAANEEYSSFGDIWDTVAHMNGGDRNASRRHINGFLQAVNDGDLIIVHTPNPIMQDVVTGVTKMIRLSSGTLGVTDPCWNLTGSIVDDPHGGNPFDG